MRGEGKAGFLSQASGFSNSATGDLSRRRERTPDGGGPRQHRLHYYRAGRHFLKFCGWANIRFYPFLEFYLDFASMRLAKYIWPLFGTFLPNTDAT